jgi:nitrite reductase/ring-hydroxylating ferredoxin subunit
MPLCISKISFFCLIPVFLISVKCDNPDQFEIPGVYLRFSINIDNDVEYYGLQAAGSSMEITAQAVGITSLGYDNNGVIVFNNGGDEFYAFDRTCPYEFPESIAVNTEGAGSAKCPKCGSIYIFSALGIPADGSPSKYGLKEYRTEYNVATGSLLVYN